MRAARSITPGSSGRFSRMPVTHNESRGVSPPSSRWVRTISATFHRRVRRRIESTPVPAAQRSREGVAVVGHIEGSITSCHNRALYMAVQLLMRMTGA